MFNVIKYIWVGYIIFFMYWIKVNGISYVEMIVVDIGYGIDVEFLLYIYDWYY